MGGCGGLCASLAARSPHFPHLTTGARRKINWHRNRHAFRNCVGGGEGGGGGGISTKNSRGVQFTPTPSRPLLPSPGPGGALLCSVIAAARRMPPLIVCRNAMRREWRGGGEGGWVGKFREGSSSQRSNHFQACPVCRRMRRTFMDARNTATPSGKLWSAMPNAVMRPVIRTWQR